MSRPSLGPAADLFDEGWSRVRGQRGRPDLGGRVGGPGRSLGRASQMVRAATGARATVFKAIRNGGTHTRTELARQLAYVATKSVCVFDARGEYDGQRVLTPAQVAAVTERFAETWDPARPTKLGHTSHLLLSFPLGTRVQAVRDVTRGVVEQFFQGDGARFDYLVAVHDDRAHRHAHVILNRHSPDGEMFFLRSGHRFSYELFREAMVEQGDRHGLRLEATRRIDRGLVTYRARPAEARRAFERGHEPPVRAREGEHLERARRHVALAASTYQGLATTARREGFEQVSEALLRASLALARHGAVLPTREFEMADTQGSFEALVREFGRNVEALEDRIASAAPAQRPRLERGLTEALASVAGLNPLGERSGTLREGPSAHGVYSEARVDRAALGRLDEPRLRAALEVAVQGTGLSAGEVAERIRVGAQSAALEAHWHAADVRAVSRQVGAVASPAMLEGVLDRLEAAYDRIEGALQQVGVLRDVAVAEEPRARVEARPSHATAAVEAEPEVPRTGPRDPMVAATAARLRDQAVAEFAFRDVAEAGAFARALERELGAGELGRLRQGDEAALARVAGDRLDRLALAKAYLEAHPDTRGTAAHHRVLERIVDEQAAARRLARGHEDEGHVHG